MPALSLPPALSALTALSRLAPPQVLHTLLRSTGYKLRPPRAVPHLPAVSRAQDGLLARGLAESRQLGQILSEERGGSLPTIVLGGFVPDATEQVFLLRGFLLRRGSVYYFNYPRAGFSVDLLCAQLDDLVEELALWHGQRPVIFAVSFGAGLVLEWLRRTRAAGRCVPLGGIVLISPVACIEDVLAPNEPKPSTLLGRALKPYVESSAEINAVVIDKSRAIFTKMFEAGAQNRASLAALLTLEELDRLRERVLQTIRTIDFTGACERVRALQQMPPISAWRAPEVLPLSLAPTLILYAEKESAVLTETSPTRRALESADAAFFPQSSRRLVAGGASPVQHASLIFHYFQFLPLIAEFYRRLKPGRSRLAA